MKKRLAAVLAFAFVVSILASGLLYWLVKNTLPQQQAQITTPVFVATRDLQVGALLRDVDIRQEGWAGDVPENALLDTGEIIDRGVVQNIYRGEVIVDSRLAPKGAGAGLAAIIPEGYRAVAIRTNEIIGVSGFVTPGMRVDVIISGNPPGISRGNMGTLTTTLLQNIEVLSAGQSIEKDREGKPVIVPVINMLATPDEAEILSLAGKEASIQLVLRNPLDTEIAQTEGTSTSRLFSNIGFLKKPVVRPAPRRVNNRTEPPPPPPKEPFKIEVYHGAAMKESQFKQDEGAGQ